MKVEERGQLKIGEAVYVLRYGKFWWGVGKIDEYGIYKGIVRRKPKCDKSIVLVDYGTINKKLVGVLDEEITDLYRTPSEAAQAEMKRLTEERKDINRKEISLMAAAVRAEKLLEQGSLELKESEEQEDQEEPEDKLECE